MAGARPRPGSGSPRRAAAATPRGYRAVGAIAAPTTAVAIAARPRASRRAPRRQPGTAVGDPGHHRKEEATGIDRRAPRLRGAAREDPSRSAPEHEAGERTAGRGRWRSRPRRAATRRARAGARASRRPAAQASPRRAGHDGRDEDRRHRDHRRDGRADVPRRERLEEQQSPPEGRRRRDAAEQCPRHPARPEQPGSLRSAAGSARACRWVTTMISAPVTRRRDRRSPDGGDAERDVGHEDAPVAHRAPGPGPPRSHPRRRCPARPRAARARRPGSPSPRTPPGIRSAMSSTTGTSRTSQGATSSGSQRPDDPRRPAAERDTRRAARPRRWRAAHRRRSGRSPVVNPAERQQRRRGDQRRGPGAGDPSGGQRGPSRRLPDPAQHQRGDRGGQRQRGDQRITAGHGDGGRRPDDPDGPPDRDVDAMAGGAITRAIEMPAATSTP